MMTAGVEAVPSPVTTSTSNVASQPRGEIVFDNVSRFYGDVLGVNRVNLHIPPGITSLVGPNGSGKTTLMNLMTGLIHPTEGRLTVCGLTPDEPEEFFSTVGYCS